MIESLLQGFLKWSDIGKRIPNERTGKQCRERWFNHLDPSLKRGPWTEDEDDALIEAQARLGNSWTKIATEIEGRRYVVCAYLPMPHYFIFTVFISENEVKNRWYSAAIRNRRLTDTLAGSKRRLYEDDSTASSSKGTPDYFDHSAPRTPSHSMKFTILLSRPTISDEGRTRLLEDS